jgi:hypothetical protein
MSRVITPADGRFCVTADVMNAAQARARARAPARPATWCLRSQVKHLHQSARRPKHCVDGRVRSVFDKLSKALDEELDMLDLALGLTPT